MTASENSNEPFGKILVLLTWAFAWISNDSVQDIIGLMSGFVAITSGSCATVYYIVKTKNALKAKKDDEE